MSSNESACQSFVGVELAVPLVCISCSPNGSVPPGCIMPPHYIRRRCEVGGCNKRMKCSGIAGEKFRLVCPSGHEMLFHNNPRP